MTQAKFENVQGTTSPQVDWHRLIGDLLPLKLATDDKQCKTLLVSIFRNDLPNGVLQAAVSLVERDMESEARALLVDFFRENRSAARIGRRLEMLLFFQERRNSNTETSLQEFPTKVDHHCDIQADDPDSEEEFEWMPVITETTVFSDDSELRRLAVKAQSMISETATSYRDAAVLDWNGLDNLTVTVESSATVEQEIDSDRKLTALEYRLIDNVIELGEEAVDLLTYFYNNPGDRPIHAASILNCRVADINKLLSYKLRDYVYRCESGGWACVDWVCRVLENLPKLSRDRF